jgi:hypothetical protein
MNVMKDENFVILVSDLGGDLLAENLVEYSIYLEHTSRIAQRNDRGENVERNYIICVILSSSSPLHLLILSLTFSHK